MAGGSRENPIHHIFIQYRTINVVAYGTVSFMKSILFMCANNTNPSKPMERGPRIHKGIFFVNNALYRVLGNDLTLRYFVFL